jgi:hypothetical protein
MHENPLTANHQVLFKKKLVSHSQLLHLVKWAWESIIFLKGHSMLRDAKVIRLL